jgi:hypothetical protein
MCQYNIFRTEEQNFDFWKRHMKYLACFLVVLKWFLNDENRNHPLQMLKKKTAISKRIQS